MYTFKQTKQECSPLKVEVRIIFVSLNRALPYSPKGSASEVKASNRNRSDYLLASA